MAIAAKPHALCRPPTLEVWSAIGNPTDAKAFYPNSFSSKLNPKV